MKLMKRLTVVVLPAPFGRRRQKTLPKRPDFVRQMWAALYRQRRRGAGIHPAPGEWPPRPAFALLCSLNDFFK